MIWHMADRSKLPFTGVLADSLCLRSFANLFPDSTSHVCAIAGAFAGDARSVTLAGAACDASFCTQVALHPFTSLRVSSCSSQIRFVLMLSPVRPGVSDAVCRSMACLTCPSQYTWRKCLSVSGKRKLTVLFADSDAAAHDARSPLDLSCMVDSAYSMADWSVKPASTATATASYGSAGSRDAQPARQKSGEERDTSATLAALDSMYTALSSLGFQQVRCSAPCLFGPVRVGVVKACAVCDA